MAHAVKVETQIKNSINEAQRRLFIDHNVYVPAPRREYIFDDAGVRVVLHGEGLGHGPIAIYEGPHGKWWANFTLRGSGKVYPTR